MVSLGDLIVALKANIDPFKKSLNEAKGTMTAVGDQSGRLQGMIDRNWKAIAAGGAAAGAAAESFARSQAETNRTLSRLSIVTGESEKAIRASINSMVDYTFSAHDAARAMDDLIGRGIQTKEQFELILPAADTLADALGIDIVDAIDIADRALSALGIPLEEMGEHMDTITFMSEKTTVSMQNLGMTFRREAPAMKEMGLSFDDVAVAMAALEAEGRRGPRAVMGFQEAIKAAEGDVNAFWRELGVATSTLDTQRQSLAEAEGLTKRFADANNAATTVMQKMQAEIGNLLFRFGGMAEHLATLAPALIALGPAGKVGSMAVNGLRAMMVAVQGFNLALLANPITLVIAAIAALVAAGYMLVDDWTFVTDSIVASWQLLQDVALVVTDAITGFFGTMMDGIRAVWQSIMGVIESITERISSIISAMGKFVPESMRSMGKAVGDTVGDMRDNVVETVSGMALSVQRNAEEIRRAKVTTTNSMAGDVEARYHEMAQSVGSTVTTMAQDVTVTTQALKKDMSFETDVITKTTIRDFDRMSQESVQASRDMSKGMLSDLNTFETSWLSTITNIASQTSGIFGSLAKAAGSLLGGRGGGGGGGSLAGTAGTALGTAIGGPIGGAIGGFLGKTVGKLFKFAQGGIATSPTMGMIAEAGESEAVIPLSRFESMMGQSFKNGANVSDSGLGLEVRNMNNNVSRLLSMVVSNTGDTYRIQRTWNRIGLPPERTS
jgi:uncharacterized protein YukE